MSTTTSTEKLAELLIQKQKVERSSIEPLLMDHGNSEEDFIKAIISKKIVAEDDLYPVWSQILGVAYLELESEMIDPKIITSIPKEVCEKYTLVPVSRIGNELTIAMDNPLDVNAIDELEQKTNLVILPVLAPPNRIQSVIEKIYAKSDGLGEALKKIDLNALDEATLSDPIKLAKVAGDDAVIRIVDFILTEAIKEGASDIHFEPRPETFQIRYRIDGVLREAHNLPIGLSPPILSRVKILADLDIAERRKPLDGRIKFKAGKREVEFRVSTLPTVSGEKIVTRLLDQSNVILKLDELGFSTKILKEIKRLVRFPYGIIIVTGPTGSGKTTSLYGMLAEINSPGFNIVTVEDPVEYSLPLVNQVQVNVKAGRTFATTLRAILRQDPDIVMIGEIRDAETAGIAVQAALTGHLVLTTLHTNTALQAIPRLIDIGVEPYLLAPALRGVMSQRLVRRICPECITEDKPPESLLRDLGLPATDPRMKFVKGRGCRKCKGTGYAGRSAIHELVTVNEPIRDLISKGAPEAEIRREAAKVGFQPLSMDGVKKALLGITTGEEVARVSLQ